MDHQTAFVRQVFGNTSLGPGATAFQGSFPSCTFNTIAGLPPEMFPHLQMFMRNMIPGNSDAQYDRLCTSVTQLGFLGKAQRQLATGEEAKRILGNIRSIMQGISQPASLVETDEARDMLRKESLQAIDRILTTSQEVHINKSEAIRRGPLETIESMQISRNEHLSRVPQCVVRIQTWKVEAGEQGHNRKYEELSTRIDIQPELEGDPERKPYISVYIKRFRDSRYALAQPVVLGPLIIARRTIPRDSAIHDTIEIGDLEGVQRLFEKGEASLWDCDPQGRSLITYAVYQCQPGICSYLISHGADIDALEPACHGEQISRHLLTQVLYEDYARYKDFDYDLHMRHRANDCRILLLHAGADPTIGGQGSAMCEVLSDSGSFKNPKFNRKAVLDFMLRLGSHYINPKDRDSQGRTLLHHLCSIDIYGVPLEGVGILLGLGFNPDDRDYEGNTCLHIALKSFADSEYLAGLENMMVALIKAGADHRATNNCCETPGSLVDGSGRLDLQETWVSVIIKCGLAIDISDEAWHNIVCVCRCDSSSITSNEEDEKSDNQN